MARTLRRLILKHKFALGDTVLMTALVRDIATTFPGQFEILVDTHFREVWENNPYAKPLRSEVGASNAPTTRLDISYRHGIAAANRGQRIHMLSWYHRDFAAKTGMDLAPLLPKGDLYLTPQELEPIVPHRYWLIVAGGKLDLTCKWWLPERYQQVVDQLAAQGIACVQAGAKFADHRHPKLHHCLDLTGQHASARQFMNLIYHADGVIGPVTAAMHIAACFDRPYVCISGGREEPWWEQYANQDPFTFGDRCAPVKTEHRFLHTLGLLDCCKKKGCWKHHTVLLPQKDRYHRPDRVCKLPVIFPHASTPKCLEMITADQVVEAAMSYYGKEIPPLGESKAAPSPPSIPTVPALTENTVHWIDEELQPGIQKPLFNSSLSHPYVGGRFSVFVLCYGPHPDLAKSCIGSILETLPAECLDLRVGLNAVCEQTREYVKSLPQVTAIYDHPENAKKYPVMREMFNDPKHPITTPYLVWFDDDAKIVDPSMWTKLADTIVANHPHGSRLYGSLFIHDLQMYITKRLNSLQWFKAGTWHKGRHLKVRGRGGEASNGTVIEFAVGWCFALATNVMRQAQIPDSRLVHNGGDITIGAQVHQAGYKLKSFNPNKSLVWCPPREQGGRRGFSQPLPWSLP